MYGIDRSDINYFCHVQGFLNVAEKHRLDNKAATILYPCVDCRNFDPIIDSHVILGHLIMRVLHLDTHVGQIMVNVLMGLRTRPNSTLYPFTN
jgi:hypothetical protein